MWHDPAAHARDFAERYAEPMDYLAAQRMMELGIPHSQIGRPDPDHGGRWRAFFPHEGDGGGVVGEKINVDAGLFDTEGYRGGREARQGTLKLVAAFPTLTGKPKDTIIALGERSDRHHDSGPRQLAVSRAVGIGYLTVARQISSQRSSGCS